MPTAQVGDVDQLQREGHVKAPAQDHAALAGGRELGEVELRVRHELAYGDDAIDRDPGVAGAQAAVDHPQRSTATSALADPVGQFPRYPSAPILPTLQSAAALRIR